MKATKKEKISLEMVKHIADLARIQLSEKEAKKFQRDLNEILLAFSDLDRAPARCEPSFQPIPISDVLRADVLEDSWSQEKALSNTHHKEKGFFKGPRAV